MVTNGDIYTIDALYSSLSTKYRKRRQTQPQVDDGLNLGQNLDNQDIDRPNQCEIQDLDRLLEHVVFIQYFGFIGLVLE